MTTTPIEQLIQDTEGVAEPGDFQAGDSVRKAEGPSENNPDGVGGMIVSDLESAGWVTLYDTVTFEAYSVNRNMAAAQLKVRREDGTLVFQVNKPGDPWRGSVKCFLHPDQPEREHYTTMGFRVCPKATMPNMFQAENHARNKHRDEWNAVEAEREARERREDREAQIAILQSLAARNVVETNDLVEDELDEVEETVVTVRTGQCELCDWYSDARKSQSRKSSLSQHMARQHPGLE
jgi:hypothetical protein